MRNSAISISFAAALLFVPPVWAAPPSVIQPGLWEITIKTILPGSTPTTTTQICISAEKAAHPEPRKSKPADDCQVTSLMAGNQLKYQVQCARRHTTSNAEFTYTGDQYEGTVTVNDGEIEIKQVHAARRIGDCPAPGD